MTFSVFDLFLLWGLVSSSFIMFLLLTQHKVTILKKNKTNAEYKQINEGFLGSHTTIIHINEPVYLYIKAVNFFFCYVSKNNVKHTGIKM